VAVSVFNALNDKHREHPLGDVLGSRVMSWLTVPDQHRFHYVKVTVRVTRIRMARWPCFMGLGVCAVSRRRPTDWYGATRFRSNHGVDQTVDRAASTHCARNIFGAELIFWSEGNNRTDDVLQQPDNFTCYLQLATSPGITLPGACYSGLSQLHEKPTA